MAFPSVLRVRNDTIIAIDDKGLVHASQTNKKPTLVRRDEAFVTYTNGFGNLGIGDLVQISVPEGKEDSLYDTYVCPKSQGKGIYIYHVEHVRASFMDTCYRLTDESRAS